jgi:hypothetical protein
MLHQPQPAHSLEHSDTNSHTPDPTYPAAGCQKPTSVCMGATRPPGQAAPARLGLSSRSRGTHAVRRLIRASGAEMSPRRCCGRELNAGANVSKGSWMCERAWASALQTVVLVYAGQERKPVSNQCSLRLRSASKTLLNWMFGGEVEWGMQV